MDPLVFVTIPRSQQHSFIQSGKCNKLNVITCQWKQTLYIKYTMLGMPNMINFKYNKLLTTCV